MECRQEIEFLKRGNKLWVVCFLKLKGTSTCTWTLLRVSLSYWFVMISNILLGHQNDHRREVTITAAPLKTWGDFDMHHGVRICSYTMLCTWAQYAIYIKQMRKWSEICVTSFTQTNRYKNRFGIIICRAVPDLIFQKRPVPDLARVVMPNPAEARFVIFHEKA